MAIKTYKGTGLITDADFKAVKWVGKTKGGIPITIKFPQALNMGNLDWTFAEKDDVVAEIVFTSCYDNTDEQETSTDEPWEIDIDGELSLGAGGVLLGLGKFYVGTTVVALCRGGGKLTVEREYRNMNADGDRGPVKGRVIMEGSTATLTMNVLTMIAGLKDLYPAVAEVTTP